MRWAKKKAKKKKTKKRKNLKNNLRNVLQLASSFLDHGFFSKVVSLIVENMKIFRFIIIRCDLLLNNRFGVAGIKIWKINVKFLILMEFVLKALVGKSRGCWATKDCAHK